MKKATQKTITELRNALLEKLNEVESGEIRLPVAKEYFNGAGKVINTLKVQLDYCALRKEVPCIPFLAEQP